MENTIENIQALILEKEKIKIKLNSLPYDGVPEIKSINNIDYIYLRKKIAGKNTSSYVGEYSDALMAKCRECNANRRKLSKQYRLVEKQLALLGYEKQQLPTDVILNIDLARVNMKSIIYDQAILEGVSTTFMQTEDIIENGQIHSMTTSDVLKIINLKHAWEFILDEDVLMYPSNYSILETIAKLVNENIMERGGEIRFVDVRISGSSYIPPIPDEIDVKDKIREIQDLNIEKIDIAIKLMLYCMKGQIFNDGNKRTSVIFANHFLIANGQGIIVVPNELVDTFRNLLVAYYENDDEEKVSSFLKEKCWIKLKEGK